MTKRQRKQMLQAGAEQQARWERQRQENLQRGLTSEEKRADCAFCGLRISVAKYLGHIAHCSQRPKSFRKEQAQRRHGRWGQVSGGLPSLGEASLMMRSRRTRSTPAARRSHLYRRFRGRQLSDRATIRLATQRSLIRITAPSPGHPSKQGCAR